MSRSRRAIQTAAPESWGELLLDVGRGVRRRVRRGLGLDEISRRIESTPDYCELSLAFLGSSDVIKLRALVEGWSLDEIVRALGRSDRSWPWDQVAGSAGLETKDAPHDAPGLART